MDFDDQGDNLQGLPFDEKEPSNGEMAILNKLFQNKDYSEGVDTKYKLIIICTLLFVIVSLPIVDKMILSFFPSCKNQYTSLFIKAFIYMVLLFVSQKAFIELN